MNDILVDTSVWSLALRRPSAEPNPQAIELQNLITDLRVVMIGPIRQELLSGIRHPQQYQKLRNRLQAFPDLVLAAADYELAAEYFNICRSNRVQGSNTDFLICAIAVNHQLQIFTTDQDFELFQQYLPIDLYKLTP